MSHFTCEKCGENIYDSKFGYVSGCEHYPPDHKAVKVMFRDYTRAKLFLECFDKFPNIVDFLRNCI